MEHSVGWTVQVLRALVPLAAGIPVAITASRLHRSYVYWTTSIDANWHLPASQGFYSSILFQVALANHLATVLGWVGVTVTGVVAGCLVGLWRLLPSHWQHQADALPVES